MKVQNKVFIVTGAGGGIGRELVLCLLLKGARVAGTDLAPAALQETASLTGPDRDHFQEFVLDVTDRSGVEALPEQVIKRFGAVDGLINNAGIIQPFRRLNDLDYSMIERVLNVNLLGTVFFTKTFLPCLLERPEAHIVNVSSMGGFVPVPGQTMYCAAKAGVKMMSEGLASELMGTRVQVSVVFPGAVATRIRENSGLSSPEPSGGSRGTKALPPKEAAAVIVRGIERNMHRIFVGKDASMMDKLYRLNPDYAARAIAKKLRVLPS